MSEKPKLQQACRASDIDWVRRLINNGKRHYPEDALGYASHFNQLPIVRMLCEEYEIKSWSITSALWRACANGQREMALYFLAKDFPFVYKIDKSSKSTILHLAVINNSLEVVQAIIQKHFQLCDGKISVHDAFLYDSNGQTVLHAACRFDRHAIVKYLVDEKLIRADILNYNNETPLHLACYSLNVDLVRYFIQKSPESLTVRDVKYDQTPKEHVLTKEVSTEILSDGTECKPPKQFILKLFYQYELGMVLAISKMRPVPIGTLPVELMKAILFMLL